MYIYIYIYIYREREREIDRDMYIHICIHIYIYIYIYIYTHIHTSALASKTEKETIDKTYEFQGYPMNEDTTSLQDFTYWILSNANIQKHCLANMTRTDNHKTEKTNMTVTLRDIRTKKKINAWFLRNRSIMYTNSLGHYFQSHYIRGKWSVLNIAQEMNTMLGSIGNV